MKIHVCEDCGAEITEVVSDGKCPICGSTELTAFDISNTKSVSILAYAVVIVIISIAAYIIIKGF